MYSEIQFRLHPPNYKICTLNANFCTPKYINHNAFLYFYLLYWNVQFKIKNLHLEF